MIKDARLLLLVDDNPVDLEILGRTFRGVGYRVVYANSGLEALEVLQARNDVALVVADLMMPEGNGWVLANEIRRQGLKVPVVLTSGGTDVEEPRAFLRAAGSFLKSDPAERILQVVADCLGP